MRFKERALPLDWRFGLHPLKMRCFLSDSSTGRDPRGAHTFRVSLTRYGTWVRHFSLLELNFSSPPMCRCACSVCRFPAGTVGSEQQLQSGLLSLLLWALLSSQSLNIRSSWEHLRASSFLYPHSLWRSPPDPGLSTYTTYLLTVSQLTSPAGTFPLNSRPAYPQCPYWICDHHLRLHVSKSDTSSSSPNLFHLPLSLFHSSRCSGQKSWGHPWLIFFFHTHFPIQQGIQLTLPSRFI